MTAPTPQPTTYARTVRLLTRRAKHVTAALKAAKAAADPAARTSALTGLHHELRGMAGDVNHALGSRPSSSLEEQ